MSYFTSQRITYCQALVPSQIAWDVFDHLGYDNTIHLENSTINYDNPFVRNYRRCEEMLVKLGLLRQMLDTYRKWLPFNIVEVKDKTEVWGEVRRRIEETKREGCFYINHIEDEVYQSHGYLASQLHQIEHLNTNLKDIVLQLGLLITLSRQERFLAFYGANEGMPQIQGVIRHRSNMFESKCVCLLRKDLLMLKRSIFRITRGNSWVYQFQITMDQLQRYFGGAKHRKMAAQILQSRIACLIIYQKGQRNILYNKVNRLISCMDCHTMAAELTNIREEAARMQRKIGQIQSLEDLTFQTASKHITKLTEVREGSTVSWLSYMQLYTKKERQIYRALSTTNVSKNLVRFNLFIPSGELPLNIQPKPNLPPLILNIVQTDKMLPSKFDTNCMLQVPQAIVNTYGVPSYNEINPAPFYIITFGFFIGVMFGDIGHMLMAVPLIIYMKANIWFWTVIFWMGYCGLIYNDFFGLNLGIFPSCYSIYENGDESQVSYDEICVFAVGIDSIWKTSNNQMQYTNSLKMKMAVILGVIHMIFGLFLRFVNNCRQKKWVDIITLTIAQIVFMSCTFLYMDYLIVYKWSTHYQDTRDAPSIISTMIAVYVNMAKDTENQKLFWPEQRQQERVLIAFAFMMVPIMLLGKTLVIWCQRKRRGDDAANQHIEMEQLHQQQQDYEVMSNEDKNSNEDMKKKVISSPKFREFAKVHEEQPINEIMVHQFIETIEFVLGSVSNTASYLRLWALSLAHAQLSEVIFELTVLRMLQGGYGSIVGLFLVFPFFLAITFGVLICMDSLQCFLHSLRLHWVEFQNKFYQGKGYLFEPFSFNAIK